MTERGPSERLAAARECWAPAARLGRHRHRQRYAAVVLAGGYEECGSGGRLRVEAGDVLLHGCFEAHLDRFAKAGAVIMNLPLSGTWTGPGLGRVADPDRLARLAERNAAAATEALWEEYQARNAPLQDWPDLLAADLRRDPQLRLADCAFTHGLAAETLSRGFARLFAVTPTAFRAEARARRALTGLCDGRASTCLCRRAERHCRSGAYDTGHCCPKGSLRRRGAGQIGSRRQSPRPSNTDP
ncbi:MAG: AraC family transcriptional regulator [Alphaproteobacteria bacterium]|nr:AraC family transcriptional regulator [Alphaproteobacteria bacterium]